MSSSDELQRELAALRAETLQLRQRLGLVETSLARIERLSRLAEVEAIPAPPPAPVVPTLPPALPPPLPVMVAPLRLVVPPLPPVVVFPATNEKSDGKETEGRKQPTTPVSTAALAPVVAPPLPSSAPKESLELRVASYWFVRVGVGALLLAVIYFAIFLYQTVTPQLGPVGKVALLYLASGGIIAAGSWMRRRAGSEVGDRMRNFSAVVEGGGFGAVYFTTLAAHAFEPLRVFQSAGLVLTVLFAWGGFVLWLAERRDTPALASGSLLAAGLSAAVLPGSWTALAGTALFAALAAGQWWRRGWVGPSVASIIASYGAYGYWRFQAGRGLAVDGSFASEALLLTLYWVIFTAGAFAPRPGRSALRTAFLTANNTAAYCLLARIIQDAHFEWFWRFTLLAGVLLLGLAAIAHKRLGTSEATAFRVQGLLLVTLSIVQYFSGWQLGLMLCLEGLALAAAASWRDSRLLLVAGLLVSGLGAFAQLAGTALLPRPALIAGGASVALLLGAAWICLRRPLAEAPTGYPAWFEGAANAWVVFAAGLGAFLLVRELDASTLALGLAGWGFALVLCQRLVPARVLPWAGFGLHLTGFAAWVLRELPNWQGLERPIAAWVPLGLVGLCVAQDLIRRAWTPTALLPTAAVFMAGSAVALRHFLEWNAWSLAAAGLAALWVVYGWLARDHTFAVGAKMLVLAAWFVALGRQWDGMGPGLWLAFALSLSPLGLRELARRLWVLRADTAAAELEGRFSHAGLQATAQVFGWALVAVPDPWRALAFAGLALAAAGVFRWREEATAAPASLVAAGASVLFVLIAMPRPLHWADAGALVVAFAATELVRGGSISEGISATLGILRALLILLGYVWITARLRSTENAALFTAVAWTLYALALMGVGLWRRDRLVRLGALGILTLTMLRVLIYEAWSLGPLYRMASFLVLGAVLVGLGWVYNRYQDKLREWL